MIAGQHGSINKAHRSEYRQQINHPAKSELINQASIVLAKFYYRSIAAADSEYLSTSVAFSAPDGRRSYTQPPAPSWPEAAACEATDSARLAAGAAGRVALRRIDGGLQIANGLGADQQRVVEMRAVGEVDLCLTPLVTDAQLEAHQRAPGPRRLTLGRDTALLDALFDLAEADQRALVPGMV